MAIEAVPSIIAWGLQKSPAIEPILDETFDISECWIWSYDLVRYWNQPAADMTMAQSKLGHWLRVAHCVGTDISYWICPKHAKIIAESTVQYITHLDSKTKVQWHNQSSILSRHWQLIFCSQQSFKPSLSYLCSSLHFLPFATSRCHPACEGIQDTCNLDMSDTDVV